MDDMNKLIIIGNLTRTPELRTTKDGVNVCSFTVAVNRRGKDEADFFNVSAWRALGENCAKFLEKGRKVCVVGSVSVRTWETEEKHGASLEVNADDVEFLASSPVDAQTGMKIVKPDELPY